MGLSNGGDRGDRHPRVLRDLTRQAHERLTARASFGPGLTFFDWVSSGRFFADREPRNFDEWSHLQPIYQAVPSDPRGMDLTVMKAAQGGATTFALLLTAWLARGGRRQLAYFVPTERLAKSLSDTRFIRLIRDNPELHRLMGDADSLKTRRIIDEGSTAIRRLGEAIIFFTHVRGGA